MGLKDFLVDKLKKAYPALKGGQKKQVEKWLKKTKR